MTIKRLHYFSGIILSLFIGLHLFNHFWSIFGSNSHISLMESLRVVYRNPVIEGVLLLAVMIQIISGLSLFFKKRKSLTGFYDKLQLWTGMYMAFFLIIHVGAVLTGRFILKLDTNFYFGVAGLNTFPFNLFFIPYYGLAVLSFFGHVASIHFQKMKKNIFGLSPRKQAGIILGIGCIYLAINFYGLTNGFQGIEIPSSYHVLIGK